MSLDIGQVLGGRFLIERLVGRGTMGCVYQARDQSNNQRIAIRLIQPDFDNEQVAAFAENDARLAGQLANKHIAKLANVGFLPTGERCILSEYLDGESLKARIVRQGPLSEFQVAQILVQLLEGLAAAHEAGVIHRDLTPRSVMLVPGAGGSGDTAELIDFGISRLQALTGNQGAAQAAAMDTSTLQYLSPEQLNGLRDIDPRSNIYSLGVIAYEAITGRLPFAGQDFSDPTVAILQEEPTPLEELAPESSSPFAHLIRKAMARSPNARFQYADEMIAAITNWTNRAGISQAQLEGAVAAVPDRNAVAFVQPQPASNVGASSARPAQLASSAPAAVAAPAMPAAVAAPAMPAAVAAPAMPAAIAAPPMPAAIAAPPMPAAVAAPAMPAAVAAPPMPAAVAAPAMPAAIAAPPMPAVLAAPTLPAVVEPPPVPALVAEHPAMRPPMETPHTGDIDQAHVDAMFAAPPASSGSELPFGNADEFAPPEMPPVARGSSPIASSERGGALVAPAMPAQAWPTPPESSMASGAFQQPSLEPVGPSLATEHSNASPLDSAGVEQPSPAATVQETAVAPTSVEQSPADGPAPLATLEPALVVPALVPVTSSAFENAATPAYGTPPVEAPAPVQQPAVASEAPGTPPAEGTAPIMPAVRDARTILGIGGVAGYAVPAAQTAPAVASAEGAPPASQRPVQTPASSPDPGVGPQAQPGSASAVASVPQQQAAQAAAAVGPAPAVLPSPYEAGPYGAPKRSKKPLVIAAVIVGILGVGVAIAMSSGESEPQAEASAQASQAVPPPRPLEPVQPNPVSSQASAPTSADEKSKEAASSGSSLSKAMNAGLLSQSVAAAQKTSKPAPAAKPPAAKPPAAKPPAAKPPAAKPAAAVKKPAAGKPAGANPYNYR